MTVPDRPTTLMYFINASMVIGVQRYVPERSAELLCLPKQVFTAFGSCNGHVTAITSEAELNVKGKFLLLFCCYCSTLQHCSALNVGQLYKYRLDARVRHVELIRDRCEPQHL